MFVEKFQQQPAAKRYEHGFSSTTPFETRVTLLYLANIWTFKSCCKARVEMKMRQPNEAFIEIPREPFWCESPAFRNPSELFLVRVIV